MACCNAHISIWAVNVLDGLHLKLFADVRQLFLLSASMLWGCTVDDFNASPLPII